MKNEVELLEEAYEGMFKDLQFITNQVRELQAENAILKQQVDKLKVALKEKEDINA